MLKSTFIGGSYKRKNFELVEQAAFLILSIHPKSNQSAIIFAPPKTAI
jgi:hypothetical protein